LQISRFTASKPSKSAIASVEKFTRQLTTLIARYFLKCIWKHAFYRIGSVGEIQICRSATNQYFKLSTHSRSALSEMLPLWRAPSSHFPVPASFARSLPLVPMSLLPLVQKGITVMPVKS